MAPEHETHVRLSGGSRDGQPTGPHRSPYAGQDRGPAPGGGGPDDPSTTQPRRRRWRRWVLLRLLLLGLSSGGVIAAIILWAHGHGGLGLRVVAGDMLVLLALLLLL